MLGITARKGNWTFSSWPSKNIIYGYLDTHEWNKFKQGNTIMDQNGNFISFRKARKMLREIVGISWLDSLRIMNKEYIIVHLDMINSFDYNKLNTQFKIQEELINETTFMITLIKK